MNQRPFLTEHCLTYGALVLALLLCSCGETQPSDPPRPNILLILTDDMGYGDVSSAGNPYLTTPNLDQLAGQSVRFDHFYVSPVCAPTRASLLTGMYHQRVGVRGVTNGFETIDHEALTLGEILQDHDYRSGIFGKWHLGEYSPSLPNEQGFGEYIGFRTGHTAIYDDAVLERNGQPYQTQGYLTDVLTQEALDFMEKDPSHPFFCYLAYNAPHTPLHIDSADFLPFLEQGLNERTARIYAMIQNIDENVGRLIKELAGKGLLSNTLLLFMSDNGPISGWKLPQEQQRFNAGLRDQKFTIYEGGIRTQCYWKWGKNWPAKSIQNEFGAHIDVVPTLLDVLQIPFPDTTQQLDGVSLLGLISGERKQLPSRIYFEKFALETLREPAPFPGGIAREGRWKMVNGVELYDLWEDPAEKQNLAGEQSQKLEKLNQAYTDWWEASRRMRSPYRRPIPILFSATREVLLKPHHGRVVGNLQFWGQRGLLGERKGSHPSGVDGDWVQGWQTSKDQIIWQIDVHEAATYELGIVYRTTNACSPFAMSLNIGSHSMEKGQIGPTSIWTYQKFATEELSKGRVTLRLQSEEIPADCQLEVKEVVIQVP